MLHIFMIVIILVYVIWNYVIYLVWPQILIGITRNVREYRFDCIYCDLVSPLCNINRFNFMLQMYNRKLFVIFIIICNPGVPSIRCIFGKAFRRSWCFLEGVSTEVQGTKELVSDFVIEYQIFYLQEGHTRISLFMLCISFICLHASLNRHN